MQLFQLLSLAHLPSACFISEPDHTDPHNLTNRMQRFEIYAINVRLNIFTGTKELNPVLFILLK